MLKGVTEKEYEIVLAILDKFPNAKFFAYGSRVKGGFSALSDLDILVKSENFDEIISDLKYLFDQSYLPYVVNFADYNSIDEKFYNLIKNDLVEII